MIGILQCGDPPAELQQTFGPYGAMVTRMLGTAPDFASAVRIMDVTRGELPLDPDAFEAFVLTGSPAGVYEDHPWIPPLLDFLRSVKGRTKLVGICFGHQAMAQAFGGRVQKSEKGWGIGIQRYNVLRRTAWMDSLDPVAVPVSHQDQVVIAPAGAQVVVASQFTPFAGLDYGDAISFQFHPEFQPAFGAALIQVRRDRYGALADPAIASYREPDDCLRVGGWIRSFLRPQGP